MEIKEYRTPQYVRRQRYRRRQRQRLYILAGGCLLLAVLLVCTGFWIFGGDKTPPPDEDDGGQGVQTGQDGGENSEAVEPAPEVPVKTGPIVALDPGHGGVQPGCEYDHILEKDITMAITLLVKEKLEAADVAVVMTREGDVDVKLAERCVIANEADADLFVSIHCNAYAEDTSVAGFEAYYYQSEDGKVLADLILAAAKDGGIRTRRVKEESYQVLRETTMPATLLEIGFMSNPDELKSLCDAAYQDTMAEAICKGILDMLER